jgi:hypothetical protein
MCIKDRPDIVARVCEIKFKDLIFKINNKGIFGPCANYVSVKEFQKRELPDEHICVGLKDGNKFQRIDVIDSLCFC